MEFKTVEKETIGDLHFPLEDVLLITDEKNRRKQEVDRAISLGNLEKHKVKIFFQDDQEPKMVNTTIWAVTEEAIVLKQNTIIPMKRIFKLEI